MYYATRLGLGSRIKAMRRAKGFTAAELAHKVGVTENAIRKLEAGDSKEPRLSTALRLADALGVAPSFISVVAVKDKHHAAGPDLAAVITAIREARSALTRIGIRHLRVFGSVARGTARNDSDIDVIVEPEQETFTLFDLASVREALEKAVHRRVDIITEQTLKRSAFRLAADNEAVIVF